MIFEVYSDGSTRNNGRADAIGAWAYVILNEGKNIHEDCRAEIGTTNQRMELTGAVEALEYLFHNHLAVPFDRVVVYTDSAYLHNCYTQKWYVNWQNNGWRNASSIFIRSIFCESTFSFWIPRNIISSKYLFRSFFKNF